jgi:hypothetical protein
MRVGYERIIVPVSGGINSEVVRGYGSCARGLNESTLASMTSRSSCSYLQDLNTYIRVWCILYTYVSMGSV